MKKFMVFMLALCFLLSGCGNAANNDKINADDALDSATAEKTEEPEETEEPGPDVVEISVGDKINITDDISYVVEKAYFSEILYEPGSTGSLLVQGYQAEEGKVFAILKLHLTNSTTDQTVGFNDTTFTVIDNSETVYEGQILITNELGKFPRQIITSVASGEERDMFLIASVPKTVVETQGEYLFDIADETTVYRLTINPWTMESEMSDVSSGDAFELDSMDITLVESGWKKEIMPSGKLDTLYQYLKEDEGKKYLDIVIDITNKTDETINEAGISQIFSVVAREGIVDLPLTLVSENSGGGSLQTNSSFDLESGKTVRIHFYASFNDDVAAQSKTVIITAGGSNYKLSVAPMEGTQEDS